MMMLDYFYSQDKIKQFAKECYQLLLSKIVPINKLKKKYDYDYLDCANESKVIGLLKNSFINSVAFPSAFQNLTKQQKKLLLLSFVDNLGVLFNNTLVKVDSWTHRFLWHYTSGKTGPLGYRSNVRLILEQGCVLRIKLSEPDIDDIAEVMRQGLEQLIIRESKYVNLILMAKHFKERDSGLAVVKNIQDFLQDPGARVIDYQRLDKFRYADLLTMRINPQAKEKINSKDRQIKKQEYELVTIRQYN